MRKVLTTMKYMPVAMTCRILREYSFSIFASYFSHSYDSSPETSTVLRLEIDSYAEVVELARAVCTRLAFLPSQSPYILLMIPTTGTMPTVHKPKYGLRMIIYTAIPVILTTASTENRKNQVRSLCY